MFLNEYKKSIYFFDKSKKFNTKNYSLILFDENVLTLIEKNKSSFFFEIKKFSDEYFTIISFDKLQETILLNNDFQSFYRKYIIILNNLKKSNSDFFNRLNLSELINENYFFFNCVFELNDFKDSLSIIYDKKWKDWFGIKKFNKDEQDFFNLFRIKLLEINKIIKLFPILIKSIFKQKDYRGKFNEIFEMNNQITNKISKIIRIMLKNNLTKFNEINKNHDNDIKKLFNKNNFNHKFLKKTTSDKNKQLIEKIVGLTNKIWIERNL